MLVMEEASRPLPNTNHSANYFEYFGAQLAMSTATSKGSAAMPNSEMAALSTAAMAAVVVEADVAVVAVAAAAATVAEPEPVLERRSIVSRVV